MLRRPTAVALAATLLCSHAGLLAQPRPADEFRKVKLLINRDGKATQTDVTLRLEDDRLVIRSREKNGPDLKVLPYTSVKGAEYSHSKSPRWKSGTAFAVAIGVFALPIFFMKGKKHWLTVHGDEDYAVLQLDKKNYRMILPAFEARSGVKVETVTEEK